MNQRGQNGIMSASKPQVVVDHVSDLSSAKEPLLFLSSLFLQTDLFLDVGIQDDLVQSRRNPSHPASKNSGNENNPELSAMISNRPLNRPCPLL